MIKRKIRRIFERGGWLERHQSHVASPDGASVLRIMRATTLPDPSQFLKQAIESGPVVYDPDRECWVVVKHALVREALINERLFSSEYIKEFDPFLAGMDGEGHDFFASILQRSAAWFDTQFIQSFTRNWMDGFLQRSKTKGSFDAVNEIGIVLPREFTIQFLGLSPEESQRVISVLKAPRSDINKVLHSVGRQFTEIIKQRNQLSDQRTGLLAALMESEEKLSHFQVMQLIRHIWFAGTITLTGLIPACILRLCCDHDLISRLRDHPEKVKHFVSEVLRIESITQFVPRKCAADTVFGNQRMSEGHLVLLHLAAANRDPEIFENPNEIQWDRTPYKHLAFGAGTHSCLGRVIARNIAETCIKELVNGFSDLQLASAKATLPYERDVTFRALRKFIVNVE